MMEVLFVGGFAGNIGHDLHILYTLSAVQVALFDMLDVLNIDKVSNYISGLQNEDGSFYGDIWGEVDTQFSYTAVCCLSILYRLDKIDVDKAVDYIVSCKNLDGGFGCTPGGESHAGQSIYVAFTVSSSLYHLLSISHTYQPILFSLSHRSILVRVPSALLAAHVVFFLQSQL
ncbi:hypothetical protein Ddye_020416 [Dipteronia dyeriana]|uniref:Prenyltransferase alpha-alpha toroid domain-containing protein n=1 Tax=Dipteronia dyeriana TaxID=168575 RepID=A0AAD9TZP9_9ROSI|nr:hypothetical protein Ddye_020416 [Dipteronia dyeriana]